MSNQDFSTTILLSQPRQDVFRMLTNVRGWWSGLYGEEIDGSSEKLGDEFSFRAGGGAHYSKQKLIELVPDEAISWRVTYSELTFLDRPHEWTDTIIGFRLSEADGKTKVTFTHTGLVPAMECYTSCAPAWTQYLQRLAVQPVNP